MSTTPAIEHEIPPTPSQTGPSFGVFNLIYDPVNGSATYAKCILHSTYLFIWSVCIGVASGSLVSRRDETGHILSSSYGTPSDGFLAIIYAQRLPVWAARKRPWTAWRAVSRASLRRSFFFCFLSMRASESQPSSGVTSSALVWLRVFGLIKGVWFELGVFLLPILIYKTPLFKWIAPPPPPSVLNTCHNQNIWMKAWLD